MPRHPRDDLRPVVWIEPHPLQTRVEEVTRELIAKTDQVIVREKVYQFTEKYYTLYDEEKSYKKELCDAARQSDSSFPRFDDAVLDNLFHLLTLSKIDHLRPSDEESRQISRSGKKGQAHIMIEVGCRVKHSGIPALAKKIGVSSSRLEKQLRLYRKVGLVVNQANATSKRLGFIEFTARVVWRGSYLHREAFLKIQENAPLVVLKKK